MLVNRKSYTVEYLFDILRAVSILRFVSSAACQSPSAEAIQIPNRTINLRVEIRELPCKPQLEFCATYHIRFVGITSNVLEKDWINVCMQNAVDSSSSASSVYLKNTIAVVLKVVLIKIKISGVIRRLYTPYKCRGFLSDAPVLDSFKTRLFFCTAFIAICLQGITTAITRFGVCFA